MPFGDSQSQKHEKKDVLASTKKRVRSKAARRCQIERTATLGWRRLKGPESLRGSHSPANRCIGSPLCGRPGAVPCQSKAAGDTPLPALPFDPMAKWTPKEYAEAERLLAQVGAHIRQQGTPAGNPFADSERTTLSPIGGIRFIKPFDRPRILWQRCANRLSFWPRPPCCPSRKLCLRCERIAMRWNKSYKPRTSPGLTSQRLNGGRLAPCRPCWPPAPACKPCMANTTGGSLPRHLKQL